MGFGGPNEEMILKVLVAFYHCIFFGTCKIIDHLTTFCYVAYRLDWFDLYKSDKKHCG